MADPNLDLPECKGLFVGVIWQVGTGQQVPVQLDQPWLGWWGSRPMNQVLWESKQGVPLHKQAGVGWGAVPWGCYGLQLGAGVVDFEMPEQLQKCGLSCLFWQVLDGIPELELLDELDGQVQPVKCPQLLK